MARPEWECHLCAYSAEPLRRDGANAGADRLSALLGGG